MQRRVLLLRSKSNSAQRNRATEIAGLLEGWVCTSNNHPTLDRYDVIWVLDPALTLTFRDTQFRLIVWDKVPAIEEPDELTTLIVSNCAHLVLHSRTEMDLDLREQDPHSLDGVVISEIAEDVIALLKGGQNE